MPLPREEIVQLAVCLHFNRDSNSKRPNVSMSKLLWRGPKPCVFNKDILGSA